MQFSLQLALAALLITTLGVEPRVGLIGKERSADCNELTSWDDGAEDTRQ